MCKYVNIYIDIFKCTNRMMSLIRLNYRIYKYINIYIYIYTYVYTCLYIYSWTSKKNE